MFYRERGSPGWLCAILGLIGVIPLRTATVLMFQITLFDRLKPFELCVVDILRYVIHPALA